MRDRDTIKGLENLANTFLKKHPVVFGIKDSWLCYELLMQAQLLIDTQEEEIKRLADVVQKTDEAFYRKCDEVKRAKREAITEFAERLKDKSISRFQSRPYDDVVTGDIIDNLVKEMVGDTNDR